MANYRSTFTKILSWFQISEQKSLQKPSDGICAIQKDLKVTLSQTKKKEKEVLACPFQVFQH